MSKIARKIDPKKISDLKKKINDPAYIIVAIYSIAAIISKEFITESTR